MKLYFIQPQPELLKFVKNIWWCETLDGMQPSASNLAILLFRPDFPLPPPSL